MSTIVGVAAVAALIACCCVFLVTLALQIRRAAQIYDAERTTRSFKCARAAFGWFLFVVAPWRWSIRYGPMSLKRHRRYRARGVRLRVSIDGRDVTDRCVYADDCSGEVELLAHKNGKPFFNRDRGQIGTERLRGRVLIFDERMRSL